MLPTVADEQILRGSAATVSVLLRDQHGDPAEPSGTVTVGVVAADGTEVLAAGTATTAGATGVRTRALTAAQTANLAVLTATWTDSGDSSTHTTTIEVVGGYYASPAEIRAGDITLGDETKYPDARIRSARTEVEFEFERVCGFSFVPRYRRTRLSGNGSGHLVLPDPYLRRVRSVRCHTSATTYTSLDAGAIASIPAEPAGVAVRTDGGYWPAGTDNIVIEYEHGLDRPPADIVGAFMLRIRDRLNRDRRGVPDRASTFTSEAGGTYSLLVPGQRGSITGIPDVDSVLIEHAFPDVGIA
jgi:hypothetical protein